MAVVAVPSAIGARSRRVHARCHTDVMRVGHYEVLGEVARGGAGVVYRAIHVELGREVALKLLLSDRADGRARARFLQEGRALARLRHPHLLGIHDLGEHEGRPYLVLPLVAGDSLAARLEREGPLRMTDAVALCAKLADALAHAHAAGVLHRDVKPANVLLCSRTGEPLLADFGLAKDLLASEGSLSRTGEQLGTPGYWSPEQAVGERAAIGPASDVYSLGATLHALLVGEPPFVEDGLMEHVAATLQRPPTRPSAARSEVGPALDAVVLTCLAKAPEQRYASADDLRDDLLRVLRGEAVRARPPRRRSRWAIAAFALVVVVPGGAALAAWGDAGREAGVAAAAPADVEATPGPAAGALEESLNARAGGDWARARQALDALCASPSPDPETLLESAELWLDLGDARRAAADLGRLGDPEQPRAVALVVELALIGGRPDEAVDLAERAVRGAPGDPWALCARAQVAFAAGDPARAVRDLERAAERGLAVALELQAEGLQACGWHDAALDAAGRALASRPSVRAAAARARALSAMGRGEEGLAAAETLLRTGHEAARAWVARGEIRYAGGQALDAGDDACRALELAPESIAALVLRAKARWRTRRFDEALDDLQRALAVAPGRLDVRLERAVLRVSEQRYDEAIADHDAILAARPGWGQVWGLRAYARLGRDDRAGAIEDLTKQLELEPHNATPWEHRGLIRSLAGDLEGALFDTDRALELEPSAARYLARAALHERLGHDQAAAGDRATAARLGQGAPAAASAGPTITGIEIVPD